MSAPAILALALVVGLIVFFPVRRLGASGLGPAATAAYALVLWVLGMMLALRPVASRILVPLLILLYLAPFIPAPDVIRRVFGRGRGSAPAPPPMKNVTPPEAGIPPDPPGTP